MESTSAPAEPAKAAGLSVEATISDCINFAMQQNAAPLVRNLKIINNSPATSISIRPIERGYSVSIDEGADAFARSQTAR